MEKSDLISQELGLCLDCIRCQPEKPHEIALNAHARIRREWGLPGEVPRNTGGIRCDLCVNHCQISENEWGYCGLRKNVAGKIKGVSTTNGKLTWDHDPLPTNCVADWVCPGGSHCSYPDCSITEGPEYGYNNLAVFPHACTFHCRYCQNWHFRYHTFDKQYERTEALIRAVNQKTTCICYFGGDPTPQLPYLLCASRLARESNPGRILRICWETNGCMSNKLLRNVADIALSSGGCIKFDIKAWDETLHIALTSVTNRQTLENFKWLADLIPLRSEPPLLIASTLIVPGYIDSQEVSKIAAFIASLNSEIPYNLLAFHPEYKMTDLISTTSKEAQACLEAATHEGLKRVKLGNMHLLK